MQNVELKRFRKVNTISQSELASFLETSRPFISMVEQGKSKLPPDKMARILSNDRGWDVSMFEAPFHQVNVGGNSTGVIVNGNNSNSPIHQDNRQYYSDSPDVLKAQIDLLDERIKEKDAQIKQLLDILAKR